MMVDYLTELLSIIYCHSTCLTNTWDVQAANDPPKE